MVVIHGTQRFRGRVPERPAADGSQDGSQDGSSMWLGAWYATLLRWRPMVALFVNDSTLLPVLVPMAPAATLLRRFPTSVSDVLTAHRVRGDLVASCLADMTTVRVRPTVSRSVVGVVNEFSYLADTVRDDYRDDLVGLSVRLASTPCSPLYGRHISPDRELAALVLDRTAHQGPAS